MSHVAEMSLAPPLMASQATGYKSVLVAGTIQVGTSGAVDTTNSILPSGVTVAYAATGVYTITFPGAKRLVAGLATFFDASGGLVQVTGKTLTTTASDTPTMVVSVSDEADGAAEQPASGDKISFLVVAEL